MNNVKKGHAVKSSPLSSKEEESFESRFPIVRAFNHGRENPGSSFFDVARDEYIIRETRDGQGLEWYAPPPANVRIHLTFPMVSLNQMPMALFKLASRLGRHFRIQEPDIKAWSTMSRGLVFIPKGDNRFARVVASRDQVFEMHCGLPLGKALLFQNPEPELNGYIGECNPNDRNRGRGLQDSTYGIFVTGYFCALEIDLPDSDGDRIPI